MKRLARAYVFLLLFMLVVHPVRAEVIFFDDSVDQAIVPPTSARWIPGHTGGMCTSSTAAPGELCGPGTGTDESVWGYLSAPLAGATIDTVVEHYGVLTPPIPFNDFLWVIEPEHGHGIPGIFGDYLYNLIVYPDLLYMQFNSAAPEGFGCAGSVLLIGTCEHTIDGAAHGLITAGYVRWSDGSFDQIVFESADHHVPEPSAFLLLAAGLVSILRRSRSVRPRT